MRFNLDGRSFYLGYGIGGLIGVGTVCTMIYVDKNKTKWKFEYYRRKTLSLCQKWREIYEKQKTDKSEKLEKQERKVWNAFAESFGKQTAAMAELIKEGHFSEEASQEIMKWYDDFRKDLEKHQKS